MNALYIFTLEEMLKGETEALNLHKQEYPKICETMDNLFEEFSGKLNFMEAVENENIEKQNEKLKSEMKSNVQFFDAAISKMYERIEVFSHF